ncbi:MAG: formylglycine-generating enzyme family protein [Lentisphaerae bacterium]|jgi:formylglycine-generating enzyme required for sulfatase activity|nr:formylglycine-generating enzyme family protein [Lentisphaerota bacterium]
MNNKYLIVSYALVVSVLLCAGIGFCSSNIATQVHPDLSALWTNSLGMKFSPVSGTDVLFCVWQTRVKDFREFVKDKKNNNNYNYRSGTEPYVLKSDGWKQRGWKYGWDNPGFSQGDDHPVTCVSWEDGVAFCKWLTTKERAAGLIGDHQEYRLPKDWEMSVAVGLNESKGVSPKEKGGRIKDIYPWGKTFPPPLKWGNYAGSEAEDKDWPSGWGVISNWRDDHARTSPVGAYGAKHGELCDLGGNVWEWCDDIWEPGSSYRVLRGGSWDDYATEYLLSSDRGYGGPDGRSGNRGFRVVLSSSSD